MKRRGAIITAAVLFSALPAPSAAQPKPGKPPIMDARPEARARFNEGVALAKKKDWDKAYHAFLEAWQLKQHPQIALNLGRAEIEIGKFRDASEHLRYCVTRIEASDPDLALAKQWLAEAEGKAGKLSISVDVAGSDVLVDDVLMGQAPLAEVVIVDPGRHTVKASREGRTATQEVSVSGGASASVELRLPAAPVTTVVVVATAPGTGTGTGTGSGLSAVRTGVLIGGGALALVGVGLGAAFTGLALGKGDEKLACARSGDEPCAIDRANEQAGMSNIAFWSFVGGGAVALGTAAFLIFGPKEPKVVVAPAASSSGGGVVAIGRF